MIGFSGVNLGLPGPGDESYQALCVADYRNNPLGMLAFFIGHLWQNLWGDTVLSLRCLASLEMLMAVGIAGLYLWRRTGRALMSAAVFTFCILVRAPPHSSSTTGTAAHISLMPWPLWP